MNPLIRYLQIDPGEYREAGAHSLWDRIVAFLLEKRYRRFEKSLHGSSHSSWISIPWPEWFTVFTYNTTHLEWEDMGKQPLFIFVSNKFSIWSRLDGTAPSELETGFRKPFIILQWRKLWVHMERKLPVDAYGWFWAVQAPLRFGLVCHLNTTAKWMGDVGMFNRDRNDSWLQVCSHDSNLLKCRQHEEPIQDLASWKERELSTFIWIVITNLILQLS